MWFLWSNDNIYLKKDEYDDTQNGKFQNMLNGTFRAPVYFFILGILFEDLRTPEIYSFNVYA